MLATPKFFIDLAGVEQALMSSGCTKKPQQWQVFDRVFGYVCVEFKYFGLFHVVLGLLVHAVGSGYFLTYLCFDV